MFSIFGSKCLKVFASTLMLATCAGLAHAETSPSGVQYDVSKDGLYYRIENGSLTLVDADWVDDMVIPDEIGDYKVTTVGNSAFKNRIDIESVTFGTNVTFVDWHAFENCEELRSIDFSRVDNVITFNGSSFKSSGLTGELVLKNCVVKSDAFDGTKVIKVVFADATNTQIEGFNNCSELESVSFCEGITQISGFKNCVKLTSVTIPASVTRIGEQGWGTGAFRGCSALRELIFAEGSGLREIYENAFRDTALKTLKLPETVTTVQNAFRGVLFDDAWVPPLVKNFDVAALRMHYPTIERFWELPCKGECIYSPTYETEVYINEELLEELTVPMNSDFYSYSLAGIKKITVPNNTKSTSFGLRHYPNLEEIVIGAGSTQLTNCENCPKLKTITIHPKNKLTETVECSFKGCSSLESITFPESVKIFDGRFSGFKGCTSLKTVSMPNVQKILHGGFNGCIALEDVQIPELAELDEGTFQGCTSLKKIDFPKLEIITSYAFDGCESLEEVNLPMVSEVQECAFSGCKSLKSFPFAQLKKLGRSAFADCISLVEADLTGLTSAPYWSFNGCTSLRHMIVNGETFAGHCGAKQLTLMEIQGDVDELSLEGGFQGESATVVINGDVNTISSYAFRNCTNLENIIFKGKINNVGYDIFYNIPAPLNVDIADIEGWLTSNFVNERNLTIEYDYNKQFRPMWSLYHNGEKVENLVVEGLTKPVRLGAMAFCNLKSATLTCASGETSTLNDWAFYNCTQMTELNLGEGFTAMGKNALAYTGLKQFVMPESMTYCGQSAMQNNTDMEYIVISPNLKVVSDGLLWNCNSLTHLVIPEGVEEIGNRSIGMVDKLKFISLPSTLKKLSQWQGQPSLYNLHNAITIYCYARTAPYAPFETISKNVMHVPAGSLGTYEANNVWSRLTLVDDIGHNVETLPEANQVTIKPNFIPSGEEEMEIDRYVVDVYGKADEDNWDEEPLATYSFAADGTPIADAEPDAIVLRANGAAREAAQPALKIDGLKQSTSYKFAVKAYTPVGHLIMSTSEYADTTNDATDALDDIPAAAGQDGKYYNLQGIEVANPGPGLYIHNGKKVRL